MRLFAVQIFQRYFKLGYSLQQACFVKYVCPFLSDSFMTRLTRLVHAACLGGKKDSEHTLLFLPCFVTDGRSQLKFGPVWERAVSWTHHHTKTGLLQDLTVMIVSVPHGPSAQVSLRVLIFTAVDITHISICPLLERIVLLRVLKKKKQ